LYQGNAVLAWLDPGTYTLFGEQVPFGNWNFEGAVYCSTWESGGEPFLSLSAARGDAITMKLDPGDNVICDWFHYPPAEFFQSGGPDQYSFGGNTPINVVACDHPTEFHQFSGETYPQCHQVHGVHIVAYPTHAPEYAQTCMYDGYPTCILSLSALIPLTVEMDVGDIPEGWEPLCNPCTWWQYGEWTGYTMQLIPIDD
jgi:hypothetical protein